MAETTSLFKFQLERLTDKHISAVNKMYVENGGNKINEKLSKLFNHFDSNDDSYEVKIKVAALNTIYNTSIIYIQPVVDKLVSSIPQNIKGLTDTDFINLVDKVSTVTWNSESTGETITRCNLSFASKYVHFLSNREIPIYDSIIWLIMKGYMEQYSKRKFKYNEPISYVEFYKVFKEFKEQFSLSKYTNYDIDKYLWQYGKFLIKKIRDENQISQPDAKRKLQTLMKERI